MLVRFPHSIHTFAVQAAVLCGSTTAKNHKKPRIYRADREGTVYTDRNQNVNLPRHFLTRAAAFRKQKYL